MAELEGAIAQAESERQNRLAAEAQMQATQTELQAAQAAAARQSAAAPAEDVQQTARRSAEFEAELREAQERAEREEQARREAEQRVQNTEAELRAALEAARSAQSAAQLAEQVQLAEQAEAATALARASVEMERALAAEEEAEDERRADAILAAHERSPPAAAPLVTMTGIVEPEPEPEPEDEAEVMKGVIAEIMAENPGLSEEQCREAVHAAKGSHPVLGDKEFTAFARQKLGRNLEEDLRKAGRGKRVGSSPRRSKGRPRSVRGRARRGGGRVQPQRHAVALHDYPAAGTDGAEGDLHLSEGDVVVVTDASGEWWRGYVQSDPRATPGTFPSNFVKEMSAPPDWRSSPTQSPAVGAAVRDAEAFAHGKDGLPTSTKRRLNRMAEEKDSTDGAVKATPVSPSPRPRPPSRKRGHSARRTGRKVSTPAAEPAESSAAAKEEDEKPKAKTAKSKRKPKPPKRRRGGGSARAARRSEARIGAGPIRAYASGRGKEQLVQPEARDWSDGKLVDEAKRLMSEVQDIAEQAAGSAEAGTASSEVAAGVLSALPPAMVDGLAEVLRTDDLELRKRAAAVAGVLVR